MLTRKELDYIRASLSVMGQLTSGDDPSDEELSELHRKISGFLDFLKKTDRSGFELCPYSQLGDSDSNGAKGSA
jgi:hypothetical protein